MVKRKKTEDILMNTDADDISMLAEIQTDLEDISAIEFEKEIPIMPLRNMVMFPSVVMPVTIGRPSTLRLVNAAYKKKQPIAVVCQIQGDLDDPGFADLYHVGVIAKILRVFEMPGGNTTVIMQSNGPKIHLDNITRAVPYLKGTVTAIHENYEEQDSDEFKALIDTCKDLTAKFIDVSEKLSPDTVFAIKNLDNPEILVNFISSNFPFAVEEKIELLKYDVLKERMYRLIQILNREVQLANIKQNIQIRTREDIDRQQREYFLQQQIKNIQDELGGGQEDEIDELRQKGQSKRWGKEVAELFEKELSKLERINSQSPDFNVQLTYLQTLLALPWESYTTDNLNINNAEKTLNKDHYGLEKVKERILEHLAVLKLRGNMKSPIICLYGPPGVGKTSLGRSIASALKRKYVRMSLGGVHDEAEIRGHRKTYIGAMPGRIIKSLIKAESSNPVIILDEIDKLGSDHRGDPSSAMLEVLDPEQNNTFHDNYLDVDYDLSKVMFIATANNLGTIPSPLLDRMELIEVSGYITEEKVEIARRHLVPKELEANGIKKGYVKFSKQALEYIIENYTRESGVRELEKKINKIMRKIALQFARDGFELVHEIKPDDVREYLREDIFDNWNIHVHVPEGAIPKDGPSAGITMVTSLASALTQRKVKANLAMTGEITLRGKVLPVGGIKEKILAAKRAGIKDIILCEENRKNIEEIQAIYLEGVTFHYVNDIKEVLELALTDEKVNGAIDFNTTHQTNEEKK